MTLEGFLRSAEWRATPPSPAQIRGPLDADRVAAELHDLGHPDLAAEVPADLHPEEIAVWAWNALAGEGVD